jgi:glycosyltransferase involved in cell wall biosynthesis
LIHNVLPHEQKPWDRLLAKTALSQGDIFIVQTEQEANRLQDLVPGANQTICSHPVYNMFSAAGFPKTDAKNQLGISPDKKVLLFFGIVRPYKGLETLIHALALLHPRGIKPTLIVAGEFWQDKSSLLNLIEKVNIMEQVLIEDRYILDQEIPTYFSAADIFVAPYRKGTQSGAVKLALGFNLPVVLSQTIADPAILNLENYPVYIMPPDDPIELANPLEIALRDLKEKTGVSPGSKDSGWDELVSVIEDSVLEFDHPDEQDI